MQTAVPLTEAFLDSRPIFVVTVYAAEVFFLLIPSATVKLLIIANALFGSLFGDICNEIGRLY